MKKKIVTVIGARPQIIKAAAFSRAVKEKFSENIDEIIVHTGQHYDDDMSRVFFGEMDIPAPAYNLEVGSGTHGIQTARMLEGLEAVLMKEKPKAVLVYGDTNSTLAAALSAAKLHIPVIHVEAGLRSFDKSMPEEINRVMTDHASTILFAPTDTAMNNLANEGFDLSAIAPYSSSHPLVCKTGDVMYDNALRFGQKLAKVESEGIPFVLATIHRDHNTDDPEKLRRLFEALGEVSRELGIRVVMPVHPRTREKISEEQVKGWKLPEGIELRHPASYLEMLALESTCSFVVTDSGGVQKEAYFFRKPCVIMRPHTEWVEIVENGNAILAGDSLIRIMEALQHFAQHPPKEWPSIFGDGHAAEHMCEVILANI